MVGDVLADPAIEFALQILPLFPGTELFPLQHLEVVGESVDDEQIGELSPESMVECGLLPLRTIGKQLGLLHRVGGEEGGVIALFAHGQSNESLLGEFILPAVGDENLGWDLGLPLAQGFEQVDREVADRPATLWAYDVRAPAVLGEAVGQGCREQKGGVAPEIMVLLLGGLLLVMKPADWVIVRIVGQASQKAWRCQPQIARVLRFAQCPPAGMRGPFEQGLQILDGSQFAEVVETEEARRDRGEEGGVSHGSNSAQMMQQADIRCARGEGVIADHRGDRFSAKLAITAGVEVLVEGGLGWFRRFIEIVQQLLLGGVQHQDADVLPKIGAVDQQFQGTPGCLELLQRRGV